MIPFVIQFASCVLLLVFGVRDKVRKSASPSGLRLVRILGLVAGLCGFANLYLLGMEFFVARYSGAMYEIEPPGSLRLLVVGVALLVSSLPLLCVVPRIGRNPVLVIWIAAISVATLGSVWCL